MSVLRVDRVGAGGTQHADRRVVDVRRPRHGQPLRLPGLHRGPPRARRPGRSRRRSRGPATCPSVAARDRRLPQLQRGRPVGGPRRPGAAGRRAGRHARGQGDVQGLAARRPSPERVAAGRHALDPGLLLRPGDRDGTVADTPEAGAPFLTGSEEGRGPLYDITHQPLEGDDAHRSSRPRPGRQARDPIRDDQGLATRPPCRSSSLRIGKRHHHHLPRRGDRGGRAAAPGPGCSRRPRTSRRQRASTVMGLTNEFIQYITTPEEYDAPALRGRLDDLRAGGGRGDVRRARRDGHGPAQGQARAEALPVRPAPRRRRERGAVRQGGAQTAAATGQPVDTPPGAQAVFKWQGGPARRGQAARPAASSRSSGSAGKGWTAGRGRPRRLDRVDRRPRAAPTTRTGRCRTGPSGARYRLVVTANHYRLKLVKPSRVSPPAPGDEHGSPPSLMPAELGPRYGATA